AGSRRVPVVSDHRNVLFDVLVHAQDIAIPLGVDLPTPHAAAAAGATRVWSMGWPFWARRRLSGLRLTATDIDWTAGSGTDVHGPIRALLLLLTGRTQAALPMLAGNGLTQLSVHTT
ncbi:MAG TPA: maleylpyruvate isomerase family mycothiol-dependent enzyme, partial [Propionibacteriaceae bacterium]|nr:maleylpyruvate isomerase family mycothiol-dependent enzyme [Propionibacteriaceae bacterium]